MGNLKILIIEDNSLVAEALSASLNDQDYDIAGRAKTGPEAIKKANSLHPDLIIMDINLKGEMDGIQAARKIKEQRKVPIIFLTAYSDQATFDKAKSIQPDAFITKPYNEDDLGRAIDLAIHNFNEKSLLTDSNEINSNHVLSDAIFVKSEKRYVKIPIKELEFIEADGSYCKVKCKEKEYLLTMNLHSFETRIQHPQLIRINRSFIININKVETFEKDYLSISGQSITISKQHQDDFKKRILMT